MAVPTTVDTTWREGAGGGATQAWAACAGRRGGQAELGTGRWAGRRSALGALDAEHRAAAVEAPAGAAAAAAAGRRPRTLPAKTFGSPATPQQPTYWHRMTALQVKTARKSEYLRCWEAAGEVG